VKADDEGALSFTPKFEALYKELYRQTKVAAELKLTYIEDVKTNVEEWLTKNTDASEADIKNYKAGIKELLQFATIMKDLYQKQVGFSDKVKAQKGTPDDQELISRYGQPRCIGNKDDLCIALPDTSQYSSGLYFDGLTCKDAKGSPFTVNDHDSKGDVISVPYAEHFKAEQEQAAKHLEAAANSFAEIKVELPFSLHLEMLSEAMTSKKPFPYHHADMQWYKFIDSNSRILFRAGADEFDYEKIFDKCGNKALYHFRLGLVNPSASKLVDQFSGSFQKWEDKLALLIGDKELYEAQKVIIGLPEFADVIYENGDDVGGPNGTSIGQTLPNQCGEDGSLLPCENRVMLFINKTERAYSEAIMQQYIMPLFSPAVQKLFKAKGVGLKSVLLHELAHNFGPRYNQTPKGKDETIKELLKRGDISWGGTMEELKAQTGAVYFGGEILKEARAQFKAGKIDQAAMDKAELEYKEHILYDMGWNMRMILRATRQGKFAGNAYAKLAAIQVGILTKLGAITFNEESKQWDIHFEDDKFLKASQSLMATALKHYAEADFDKVDGLIRYYTQGEGFKSLHSDRINELAGKMPSVLFNYKLEGLE